MDNPNSIGLDVSPSEDTDLITKLIMDKYIQQLTTPPTPPNAFQVGMGALSQLAGGNTLASKGKMKGLGSLGQMGTSPFNTIAGGIGEGAQGALQGYNMVNPQPAPIDLNKLTAIAALQKARNGGVKSGGKPDLPLPYDVDIFDKTTGKVMATVPKGTLSSTMAGIQKELSFNMMNPINMDIRPRLPGSSAPQSSTGTASDVILNAAKAAIKAQANKEFKATGIVSDATRSKAQKLGVPVVGVK